MRYMVSVTVVSAILGIGAATILNEWAASRKAATQPTTAPTTAPCCKEIEL